MPLPDNPKIFSRVRIPIRLLLLTPIFFCIKLRRGGRASVWIDRQLKAGDRVVVMKGPFGNFAVDPAVKKIARWQQARVLRRFMLTSNGC